jgi:hypothetical protein
MRQNRNTTVQSINLVKFLTVLLLFRIEFWTMDLESALDLVKVSAQWSRALSPISRQIRALQCSIRPTGIMIGRLPELIQTHSLSVTVESRESIMSGA